jgi:hypothetical protein
VIGFDIILADRPREERRKNMLDAIIKSIERVVKGKMGGEAPHCRGSGGEVLGQSHHD